MAPLRRVVRFSLPAALLCAGAGSVAFAALPSGGDIAVDKLLIHEDGAATPTEASTEEARDRYFNAAHCVCSAASAGTEQTFAVQLSLTGATISYDRPAELWFGTQCDNDTNRAMTCRQSASGIADIDSLATEPAIKEFPLVQLMEPLGGGCQASSNDRLFWVLVDSDANGSYDYNVSTPIAADTEAPPTPRFMEAEPAEAALQLTWEAPTERAEDVLYYQALCARTDGTPAFAPAPVAARYQTPRGLCNLNFDVSLESGEFVPLKGPLIDAAPVDAAPAPDAAPAADASPAAGLPAGLTQADATFLCGEADGTATSMRISGLTNGVGYQVVLLAVDPSGNAAGIYLPDAFTPQPVTDFWEDLHDRGSEVEGGFCLLAQAYGDDSGLTRGLRAFRDGTLARSAAGRWLTTRYYEVSAAAPAWLTTHWIGRAAIAVVLAPVVALALGWHLLGLPLLLVLLLGAGLAWRRRHLLARARVRRRPARLVGAAATTLLALAAPATAQGWDPYWSDPVVTSAGAIDDQPRWHAGLRLGPYLPAIDDQAGGDPGPFEEMFGGSGLMPVIDVDWFFLRRFGQLGVGGSVGFYGKSAKAFTAGSMPGDPDRERADGDETSFRLLPLAATLVYRFTYLDDRLGIPLVPYARAGLSYYVWWVGAPDGTVAEDYPMGCTPGAAGCEANKARGASAGYQGSIGLALRAERIDGDAARSMRDSGLFHAGFYGELQLANVDGFGKDSKLSVGDTTWFVGADFEF